MIYENINAYLNECQRDNIVFCVSNFGPVDMVRNLLVSARDTGLPIVLFALDVDIAEAIDKEFDIDIVLYVAGIESNKHYKFGSKDFINISYHRYFIANKIMLTGRSLIYLDIDIVVCQDFEEEILQLLNHDDLVIQSNGVDCCTGFFGMKPTQDLIAFFDKKNMDDLEYTNYGGDGGLSDQKFVNKFVYETNLCKIKLLDRDGYPNGAYYYRDSERLNASGLLRLIHFNCVIGYEKKLETMAKYNKWYI